MIPLLVITPAIVVSVLVVARVESLHCFMEIDLVPRKAIAPWQKAPELEDAVVVKHHASHRDVVVRRADLGEIATPSSTLLSFQGSEP